MILCFYEIVPFARFVTLLETLFEETCTECDRRLIHCDGQLSRQKKERTQGLNLLVLEEKFLKCIPWEFLPLNETHFYSLYSHHMSLLDLLGMSAQPKYDSGSSVLKQFFLLLQKLEIFQQDITERQMLPHHLRISWMQLLCSFYTGLRSLQIDKWEMKFKDVCKDKSFWNVLCLRPSVCQYAVQEKAGQYILKQLFPKCR